MKAVVYHQYGSPEVLQIIDLPKPQPKDTEVLIKLYATTVNRTDCGFRNPEYFFIKFISGISKPKNKILGTEVAGVIEAIGANVSQFKVGDKVFGLNTFKFGTHAEFVCVDENKAITNMPTNVSFEQAAAICDGAFLAYNYLKDINFKKHPKLLINGASGSIGSSAVQLAKYMGAEITAVCNTKNIDLVKSLGATRVIDYLKEDFTNCGDVFDTVLDAVGKITFSKCKKLLKPGGIYFSTELGPWMQNVYLPILTSIFGNKKVKFPLPVDKKEDIVFFKSLVESQNYKAIIYKIYSLDQIIEATKYVELGEKTGNVVIKISETVLPN